MGVNVIVLCNKHHLLADRVLRKDGEHSDEGDFRCRKCDIILTVKLTTQDKIE